MEKTFHFGSKDLLRFTGLVALWLVAYKSADLFNFFATYFSLWFLPAGVTLAVAMTAPPKLLLAPLVANLLLAIPAACSLLGIEFTNVRDPLLHSIRLYAIYAGAGLFIRYILQLRLPIENLPDQLKLLVVVLTAAALGAFSGVSLHVAVGNFPWAVAWDILLPWGIGDAIGSLIVVPVLVPILLRTLKSRKAINLPNWQHVAFQAIVVLFTMFIAFWAPPLGPHFGPLSYLILLPPIVFAVRGGLPSAATAIALTALLTPPAATWFGFEGERISLQFLLLLTAISTLMIGGAVSDREAAFEAVKDSEENLTLEVEAQTKDLREAYEFQQHLVRSIGHDLRQPMLSLNMMLDGLAIEHKDTAAAAPLDHAKGISRTATGFIEKVLAYAKREAGKVEVISANFALQRVFDGIKQTFASEAHERNVELIVVPTNYQLASDKDLVWEAIANLVQNSIRMSTDGQTITLKAELDDLGVSIVVVDEIDAFEIEPGQAGFGLEIVKQVARILGAEFQQKPNLAVLRFGALSA